MKGALVLLLALQLGDASRVLRSQGVASGNATVDLEDADAIAKGVEADARADLDDVDAIRRASGLESHRARDTLERASEDVEDGQAIAKADKLWSKAADAQGEKDLKDPKDRDALVRAHALEVKAQDTDAAQMQLLASKEQADGEASLKHSLSMGADAEVLEHEAMAKLEREGADVSALRAAAASEAGAKKAQRTCSVEGKGINADITTSPTSVPASGGDWTFTGAGKVKVAHVACPISANDPIPAADETITNGGASDAKDFECKGACCVTYCCGTGDCLSTFLLKNTTAAQAGSKRVCLSSELYTRTTTAATNASDEVGMTPWVEETAAAGSCVTGLGGGAGLAEFKLCGPGTLELSTGMNCGGPDSTVVHDTDKTAADCTVVEKPTGGYWNSYKVTCALGLER